MKKTFSIAAAIAAAVAITGCGLSAQISADIKGKEYNAGFVNNTNTGVTTVTGGQGTNDATITIKQ